MSKSCQQLGRSAPLHLNHLISLSQHKKGHSLTALDTSLLVTGAQQGEEEEKKVYFSKPSVGESWPEYITEWYVIIKHWPSGCEEKDRDGRMGASEGEHKLGWGMVEQEWRGEGVRERVQREEGERRKPTDYYQAVIMVGAKTDIEVLIDF